MKRYEKSILPKTYVGPRKFVFSKLTNIGSADAMQDRKYLSEVFLDNGALDVLLDTENPQCIVVGRTGSGKTALIDELKYQVDRISVLNPDDLAISYLSNNVLLKFFIDAGVKMDLFYKLLWRHIFLVEIIKKHFNIVDEESRDSFLSKIGNLLTGKKSKKEAINYLLNWGKEFWKESDYRITEMTSKLETDLQGSLEASGKANLPNILDASGKLNISSGKKLTEEEKREITRIGQPIVDSMQIKKMSEVMEFLENDILTDSQKRYYIAIDKLDENWIDDYLRYPILKSLIEAAKNINDRVKNVKIVVALREDLINRVFSLTKDPGFQQEKYKSMYVPLYWNSSELTDLLTKRVEKLLKDQKASNVSKIHDILPLKVNKLEPIEYFIERTLMRPRDLIMFFNECIISTHGKSKISKETIVDAENHYSANRIQALYDEWKIDYPNILILMSFLSKYTENFTIDEIKDRFEDSCLDFWTRGNADQDAIYFKINERLKNKEIYGLVKDCMKILYRIGMIGIRLQTYTVIQWSFDRPVSMETEIPDDAVFYIHKAFWQFLNIKRK
jgi:hypothetical protein